VYIKGLRNRRAERLLQAIGRMVRKTTKILPYEAGFYTKKKDGSVQCRLCVRKCLIQQGETGFCTVRYNESGTLYTHVHGKVAAIHVAPSEIKPFFHFYPGAIWLSMGTIGCNLKCPGCQNWHLAHSMPNPALLSTEYMTPEHVAEMAERALCVGLSFTYNEPTVWLEFTLEAARAALNRDLLSTYVSNGMMSTEALKALLEVIAAFRFDVKGFSKKTYEAVASPINFQQVKRNAKLVSQSGGHLEIVTNIVPGRNDNIEELAELASWIKNDLGQHVPWHVTRFHPSYMLSDVEPTPLETLENAYEAGKQAGLDFVYIGNVPGHPAESTVCPKCGRIVIQRLGLSVENTSLDGTRCKWCGYDLHVVGSPESGD
jgi:pyruvate formate lyase activating enzyme